MSEHVTGVGRAPLWKAHIVYFVSGPHEKQIRCHSTSDDKRLV